MFPNPLIPLVVSVVVLGILGLLGFFIAKNFTIKAHSYLSLPLGFAVFSGLSIPVNHFMGVGLSQSLFIILLLMVSALYSRLKNKKKVNLSISFIPVVLAVLFSIVVTSSLFLKLSGSEVFLSSPIFDHAKIAIIDSIKRDGLPIKNPFSFSSPDSETFNYYYLWYLVAANIATLFGVSGWVADITMTFITTLSTIFIILAVLREIINVNKKYEAFTVLILFSSNVLWLINDLSNGTIWKIMAHEHGLESLLIQAAWVPQHVASACFCILFFFYICFSNNKNNPANFLFLSLCAAAGAGSSTWVGAVTFGVTAILIFIFDFIKNENSKKEVFLKWVTIAVLALIIALPILINQIGAAGSVKTSPVGLHTYDASIFGKWYSDIIVFLFIFVPVFLPMAALGIGMGLKVLIFKKLDDKCSLLFIVAISSCLVSLFLRSQIANNDLGWRAIILFSIIGPALLAIFLQKNEKSSFSIFTHILLGITLISALTFSKSLMIGSHSFKLEDGFNPYEEIKTNNFSNGRLLLNVRKYEGKEIFDGNIIPPIFINQNQCFDNVTYALAFGAAWGNKTWDMWDATKKIFDGSAGEHEMNLMSEYHCSYLVVMVGDPIWHDFPYNKYGWKLQKETEHIKIYSKEALGR